MNVAVNMSAEWERIELLCACLSLSRQGEEISDEFEGLLGSLQHQVSNERQQHPWQDLASKYNLTPLDQDILVAVMAPVAEPRIGWIYQQLQAGISGSYPSSAFIQELFFMEQDDGKNMRARLSDSAPLIRAGLIHSSPKEPYESLQPTSRARLELLDEHALSIAPPPGTVEIHEKATWDDIVLPPYCLQSLKEYILWITQRERVIDEWGGKPIGGPVALFAGPSGTGKTFSAIVLANELGWPLFRVDLGMLVSKYVGETEKNFNKLFDAAHDQNMVLLFDEAESLFGKRADIRDARDRFSNMEISHLLSRIERHQGPCILTTNLRKHLDAAFARRFQTVIEFPRPDARARSQLWSKHIPPRAPRDESLDTDLLGNEIKLTGGQIRNAALHAAFLAAGEAKPISLRHMARAIWVELGKSGKEIIPSSLGMLAEHLA